MKTLQKQQIEAVSGGSNVGGESGRDESLLTRSRCQYLCPTFAPQSNPNRLPIAPTTDPVNPVDPVELSEPKNSLPGPTTDPVMPVWID